MKKVYLILTVIISTVLIICITYTLKQNKKCLEEIKRLEKIIELKQETNKEYVYLFKTTEHKDMKQEIKNKQYAIDENKSRIENLQNTVSQLQEENVNINEEIEEIKNKILEEQIRKEQEELARSTVKIDREITYSQFPNYPTGCESAALYILLKYYDVDVTIDQIVDSLKKGSLPYKIEDEIYGGNPEEEFIGDPRDDSSYGVYNKPIAEVAKKFKPEVQNIEGLELEQVLELVSQNRPVMVWTTIGNLPSRISSMWIYRKTGEKIYWKENEHAVVIIGYNNQQVIVSDPYTGRITRYNKETFIENYNYMGKRAVYY